jgi:cytochrome c oxidase subunit 4
MLRDDIIEYSLDAHHSEEQGKKIRKKIWQVTVILTVITILEVGVGIIWTKSSLGETSWAWFSIKVGYILLTLIKAAYIVMVFMHLGDERKAMRYVILIPYFIFICYLIFIALYEGTALGNIWEVYMA